MARKQKQWEVADKNIEGQYIQIQYIQKTPMDNGNREFSADSDSDLQSSLSQGLVG